MNRMNESLQYDEANIYFKIQRTVRLISRNKKGERERERKRKILYIYIYIYWWINIIQYNTIYYIIFVPFLTP